MAVFKVAVAHMSAVEVTVGAAHMRQLAQLTQRTTASTVAVLAVQHVRLLRQSGSINNLARYYLH